MIKFFDATGNQIIDGHVTTVIIVPGMLAPQTVSVPIYVDGVLRTDAELEKLGVTVEQISEEIVDKEKFIIAVRSLVQPEAVAAVMQNIPALMSAIFSISMLTTGAAPGNDINLLHPEVTNFLTLAGLTIDQVKNKMAEA